jgi:hypothetical protein
MRIAFILAFFLLSCTHWIIETETRIRAKNSTNFTISDLCIVSKNKNEKPIVLVSGSIKSGETSKPSDEIELVGEFSFMVFVEGVPKDLGTHKLKGGSVLAIIEEKGGEFKMVLK